jgi:hypothetical protein
MFTNQEPRPAEWLHSRKCLAAAVIAAVENLRDEEGSSDLAFRLAMQDGPLAVADGYLADGLMTCICPEPETCGATYPPLAYVSCTLPAGHAGDHEDSASDAPSTLAWAEPFGDIDRTEPCDEHGLAGCSNAFCVAEAGGIDRAAEADYRAHSSSITGVYEAP